MQRFDNNFKRVDTYGFDGRRPKRAKIAAELDDNDFGALVTQGELLFAKTYFTVADSGTTLVHAIFEDENSDITNTQRHEVELYGFTVTKSPSDSSQIAKLIFYDTAHPSNGTDTVFFSVGIPAVGGLFNITLPSAVRFQNGISMRCVNADNTRGVMLDVVTLFYRNVSFHSHYAKADSAVNAGDSIQVAIDSAPEDAGVVIRVGTGTYNENIILNKNGITLQTTQGAVLSGTVRLEANNIAIEGFTLSGPVDGQIRRGIEIAGGNNIEIRNMNVSQFTTGASLDFSSQLPKPSNVLFVGNTFVGNVSAIGSTENVTNLTLMRNRFENNQEGVGLGAGVTLAGSGIGKIFFENLFYDNVVAVADYRQGSPPTEYGDDGNVVGSGNGTVTSVTITEPGSGYSFTPPVSFSLPDEPGGVTAQGDAVVFSEAIQSITITEAGSGYITAPTVTIGPPGLGGVQAQALAIIS